MVKLHQKNPSGGTCSEITDPKCQGPGRQGKTETLSPMGGILDWILEQKKEHQWENWQNPNKFYKAINTIVLRLILTFDSPVVKEGVLKNAGCGLCGNSCTIFSTLNLSQNKKLNNFKKESLA